MKKKYLWLSLLAVGLIVSHVALGRFSKFDIKTNSNAPSLQSFVQSTINFAGMKSKVKIKSIAKVGEGRFEVNLRHSALVSSGYISQLKDYIKTYGLRGEASQIRVKSEKVSGFWIFDTFMFLSNHLWLWDTFGLLLLASLTLRPFVKAQLAKFEIKKVSTLPVPTQMAKPNPDQTLQLQKELKRLSSSWGASIDEVHVLKKQMENLRVENAILKTKTFAATRQREILEKEFSQNLRSKFPNHQTRNLDLL